MKEGSNKKMKPYLIKLFVVCLALAAAPAVSAATCESLANLKLTKTTIISARSVAIGAFTMPPDTPPSREAFDIYKILPAFCRVQGIIQPSNESHIGFEVWLPASGWNGKYVGAGNGSFHGLINYDRLADAVHAGYATSSTDVGHKDDETNWMDHPEKVIDWGYRAVHETAEKSKLIIRAFYGESPKQSYFNSCSNGGRQGLMEAQLFPADYDGILAGDPALDFGRDLGMHVKDDLKVFRDRGGKLILYQGGTYDPLKTVRYYQSLVSRMGQDNVSEFVRLYLVPGMEHCGGLPDVDDFGQRLTSNGDADHSLSMALEQWVEKGIAPKKVTATKYKIDSDPASGSVETRPLCPYPLEGHYIGPGSRFNASNFVCADRK
jgi:hypothetical protein